MHFTLKMQFKDLTAYVGVLPTIEAAEKEREEQIEVFKSSVTKWEILDKNGKVLRGWREF